MTSPAPVDVKGKGKARGRRRPQADGTTGDASGAPASRPGSPDEEAATEAASADAPRPGDTDDATTAGPAGERPSGHSGPDDADSEADEPGADPDDDATGRWDAIGTQEGLPERAGPGLPGDRAPAAAGRGVNPAAPARGAARQRRAQEHADQAAEIEAALAESGGESRRRQRDQKRAAATAAAAAAAVAGESRSEQRARKRAAAAAVGGDGGPSGGPRRRRRSQERAESAGDPAGGSRRERKARRRQAEFDDDNDSVGWAGGLVEPPEGEPPDPWGTERELTGRSWTGWETDDDEPVAEPAPSQTAPTVAGALTAAAAAAAATGGVEPEPRPRTGAEPGRARRPEPTPPPEPAPVRRPVGDRQPDTEPEPDAVVSPLTAPDPDDAAGVEGVVVVSPVADEPDDAAAGEGLVVLGAATRDEPDVAAGVEGVVLIGPVADEPDDADHADHAAQPAAVDRPVQPTAPEPRFVPRPMPAAGGTTPTGDGWAGQAVPPAPTPRRPAPAQPPAAVPGIGDPGSAEPRAGDPGADRTATLPVRPLPTKRVPTKRAPGGRPPAPPGPGPGSRPGPEPGATPPSPGRRGKQVPRAVVLRQRRRRRRIVIGTTILLVVVNLLVGSAYVYFQWRLDQINRVPVPGLADDVPGEVMNVLLVGSDSRERLTGQDAAQAGKDEVSGERSDTIMVLHVDPRQQRAAILAVPRDLYVPIPGTNGSDRVNAAFATGGAERLIGALSGIGVQVNHYAEVDFVGFKEIVDAMGGVPVFLPNWVRDFSSGLDVPRSGCVELNGSEALAYVRSRQFESLVDGKWVTDPRGDLGRIERQQDFIRRVMKKGVSAGVSNPVALNRLIGIGVRNLTVDDTMSTKDITNVARRFRTVDPDSVETLVLPTTPQTIDGKAVLVLQNEAAQDEIAKINGAAPLSPPPTPGGTGPTTPGAGPVKASDVRIQVLNGNGTRGVAKGTADALKTAGFSVVSTGDTPTVSRTVVRYASGQEAKARFIAAGLAAGAQLQADAKLTSADVVLVLGADYKGFGDPNAPPTTAAGRTQATTPGATTPAPAAAPAPATTTPPKPPC